MAVGLVPCLQQINEILKTAKTLFTQMCKRMQKQKNIYQHIKKQQPHINEATEHIHRTLPH